MGTEQADDQTDCSVLPHKKRKSDNLDRDVDDDAQQSKRVKMDFCAAQDEVERLPEEKEESMRTSQQDHSSASKSQTSSHQSSKVLSDHIKVKFFT